MISDFIDGAIAKRKLVVAIMVVLSLFGLGGYLSMPRESNPNIPFPFISVQVPIPGVSPEDAERLVVRPLETQLKSIDGLKEMQGYAMQGAALISMEFEVNIDTQKALNEVRAKVDIARAQFPEDAREPVIEEYNANRDPIITVMLSGNAPERTLYRVSKALKRKLESIPGVFAADFYGGREEVMEVIIDPARLENFGITSAELFNTIAGNNRLVPAGNLMTPTGKFAIKVAGVIETPQDVLSLPITARGDKVVTLGDVADVRRTFKEPESIARFNGQPAFSIDVSKRAGANILDTVKLVRAAVAEEQKRWPGTIQVAYTYDQSDFIKDTLTLLQSALIIAIVLVMIIVVATLGLRSGLLVGVGIPVCFLMAFLMMRNLGFTINIMVMFGLVLAVGILVDGGIVVVEYADRKMAEGHNKLTAYALASKRMFWPVINGTLTTLCAFVPFLFWESIAGKFMSFLPKTLFFVLGSSLVVALLFTPVLGSLFGKTEMDEEELANIHQSETGDPRQMRGFMGWYANTIDWAIHRPWRLIFGALAVSILIFAWFGGTKHRTEFFLDEDPEQVTVYVQARGNLSVEAMNALSAEVEKRITGLEGVESSYVRVSRAKSFGQGSAPTDNIARITLDFLPFGQRPKGRSIVAELRKRVADIPGLRVEVRTPQGGPPQGKDIQIELQSWDYKALNAAAAAVKHKLEATPGLIEIGDSLPLPGIDWDMRVDREEAGKYGANVSSIGAAIQLVTNGILVARYRPDDTDDEVDIRVRYPESDRNLSTLDDLKITTASGAVPLSYFVKRIAVPQVDSIKRRDGERYVLVEANAKEGVAANLKIEALKKWLETSPISKNVSWKFRGGDEESANAAKFFGGAMATSLFLMGVILMWQFNSFYSVFLTLLAVVLSTIGVLLGIQLNIAGTYDYISVIMTGTGIVALAGVVVGHNIVLVDTYHHLKREGLPSDEAAVRAAVQRFRPVVLTTITTVIGLLPLMFKIEPDFFTGHVQVAPPGSEWWVQLAGAVVWGLTFSTLLTLVLIPALLGAPYVFKRNWPTSWMARLTRRITNLLPFGRLS
jgi:multidrug efflux pump